MRLVKQLVAVAAVAFAGKALVGAVSRNAFFTLIFGFMAAAAVTEELVFRGVLFRIVEQRTGTVTALVVTGLLPTGVFLYVARRRGNLVPRRRRTDATLVQTP
ncbi:CPBP family intramembrane glutamic endopeptidase [Nonomuraea sp. NPDC049421]|uniref:CPBP family intramembrane glutamic endopeptidase n=1 Tax=Nonomuraea sp. NPDC049421 TaxID=3155275 RepID=UPI00342EF21E